ncbi:hypothetical protein Micbo1qcDRAFT_49420 [Microdochium bolleyi]|uniref:Uncharacterized protein n=1 Tax=Microdochium bolleyi TaxID=196109 RepID=A0A136J5V3_9PEZI|nr:hypothetical protein Micbo1qcDRAFT_49420 [Microdochium bolleyi]
MTGRTHADPSLNSEHCSQQRGIWEHTLLAVSQLLQLKARDAHSSRDALQHIPPHGQPPGCTRPPSTLRYVWMTEQQVAAITGVQGWWRLRQEIRTGSTVQSLLPRSGHIPDDIQRPSPDVHAINDKGREALWQDSLFWLSGAYHLPHPARPAARRLPHTEIRGRV